MFKKIVCAAALVTALTVALFACSLETSLNDPDMAQELRSLERQGYTITGADYQQIYYFMMPTAPYQDGTVVVTLFRPSGFRPEGYVATITGEAWVLNKGGRCDVKNVSTTVVIQDPAL